MQFRFTDAFNYKNLDATQVWACGGGTQSALIGLLICQGVLPKPSIAAIVDTGREISTTWGYYNNVLYPNLKRAGVELVRVDKSLFATVDLYRDGELLIPAFTDASGEKGKLTTFCSNEWKRRVMQRYLRSLGVDRCQTWLGISVDEQYRVKPSGLQWNENRYPLIEMGIRRAECYTLLARAGWPRPTSSRCWMCPNQDADEWMQMKEDTPDDFQLAVNFEQEIRGGTKTYTSRKPWLRSTRWTSYKSKEAERDPATADSASCEGKSIWQNQR